MKYFYLDFHSLKGCWISGAGREAMGRGWGMTLALVVLAFQVQV